MWQELKHWLNHDLVTTASGMRISVADIIFIVLLVLAGYLLSKLVEYVLARKLKKTSLSPDVVHAFKRISFYTILVVVVASILSLLGIPVTAFAFATGAIAIGLGFGAQNIINNFISGWILIAERPIRVGDLIEFEGEYCTVIEVGARSTLVHRLDGVHVLIPNSHLLEKTLVNWTLVDGLIRHQIRVGVGYQSNPKQVSELLLQIATSHPSVLETPVPEVIFEDFGDSALIFDMYFWSDVKAGKALRCIRSELRMAIHEQFAEFGIEIAFPQRDINIRGVVPVNVTGNS